MADNPVLSDEVREEIVSGFEHRLRAAYNSITDSAEVCEQMLGEVRSVLSEVVNSLQEPTEQPGHRVTLWRGEIGTSPAIEGIHPAALLSAATVLYETALPPVRRAFATVEQPPAEDEVALLLHRVIMSRIGSDAMHNMTIMIKAVHDARRAERDRLARNLHDRVSHSIGVALHRLELHRVYASKDEFAARTQLRQADVAMRQALDGVIHFADDSRTTVRPVQLKQALTAYLAANAEDSVATQRRGHR